MRLRMHSLTDETAGESRISRAVIHSLLRELANLSLESSVLRRPLDRKGLRRRSVLDPGSQRVEGGGRLPTDTTGAVAKAGNHEETVEVVKGGGDFDGFVVVVDASAGRDDSISLDSND